MFGKVNSSSSPAWQMRGIGASEAQTLQGQLEALGLWQPGFDTWSNQNPENPVPVSPADYSPLAGYRYGEARGPGDLVHRGLFGPDGNMLSGYTDSYHKSMTGRDWGDAATAVLAPLAAGYGAQYLAGGGAGAGAGAGAAADGTFTLSGAEMAASSPEWNALLAGGAEGGTGTLGTIGSGSLGSSGSLVPMGAYTPTAATMATAAPLAEVGAAPWISGMSNGSVLNAGLQVGSALMQNNAAGKVANAQLAAGQQANDLQRYMYDTQRADNAPLVGLRDSVLPQIQALLKDPNSITTQPGYQFGLKQGLNALNTGAAARGMTYSGQQGKALQQFGQDYAGTKLDQSLSRLTSAAGLGQVGSNNNQAAGTSYANNVGNNLLNMGNVRGSSYAAGANAWGGAIGNVANQLQMENLLRQYQGGP